MQSEVNLKSAGYWGFMLFHFLPMLFSAIKFSTIKMSVKLTLNEKIFPCKYSWEEIAELQATAVNSLANDKQQSAVFLDSIAMTKNKYLCQSYYKKSEML